MAPSRRPPPCAPFVALVVGAALACGRSPRTVDPAPQGDGPAAGFVLHPPRDYAGAFLMRQHLSVRHGGRVVELDAVVQKKGDELVILAFTPFGTRAFTLLQRGDQVTFEAQVDAPVAFPPRYILYDVHRALLASVGPGPWPDGVVKASVDGARVTETWRGGALEERTFQALSGHPPGVVRVHFDPPRPPAGPGATAPFRMVLTNEPLGYVIDIETSEVHDLSK